MNGGSSNRLQNGSLKMQNGASTAKDDYSSEDEDEVDEELEEEEDSDDEDNARLCGRG